MQALVSLIKNEFKSKSDFFFSGMFTFDLNMNDIQYIQTNTFSLKKKHVLHFDDLCALGSED